MGLKENCIGFLQRTLGISEGGYVSPHPRNARRGLEEVDGPENAEVVGVYRNGDGFPDHVGTYDPRSDSVSHRRGPGEPEEHGVPVDEALKGYENSSTTRKWFRRSKE